MNNWILKAYSDVYSTAMLHDTKPKAIVAIAKKTNENRFSKLVRMFGHA